MTAGFKEICATPKSLVGRTIFLGLFVGFFTAFFLGVGRYATKAFDVLCNGSSFMFDSQSAVAAHAMRSAAAIFAVILNFWVVSTIAFAGEWLFIYIIFRAVRNAPMGSQQYWRVWLCSLLLAFIAPIFTYCGAQWFPLLIESAIINGILFAIFYRVAKYSFSTNPPSGTGVWKEELSRAEFVGIVRKKVRAAYPHFKRNVVIVVLLLSILGLVAGA